MKLTIAIWEENDLPTDIEIEVPGSADTEAALMANGDIVCSMCAEMFEAVGEALEEFPEAPLEDVTWYMPLAGCVERLLADYRAGDGKVHVTTKDRADLTALAALLENEAARVRAALAEAVPATEDDEVIH